MRRWVAFFFGVIVVVLVAGLAVAVERSDELREWLDETAPLAPWLTAAAVLMLALATFVLARRVSEEAHAVSMQSAALAEQVALQLDRSEHAAAPLVYPVVTPQWTPGARRRDWLLVRNGGLGPALSVRGTVRWKADETQEVHTALLESGALGPGEERWYRLAQPGIENWHRARGEIDFTAIDGRRWQALFSVQVEPGEIAVLRVHAMNRLFD